MPHAPTSRLLSGPAFLPFQLKLALRAGVGSADLIPLLVLAERSPASLRVGLFERLRTVDWVLLGLTAVAAISIPVAVALGARPSTILLGFGLTLPPGAAFLCGYVWRLRDLLTRRARDFAQRNIDHTTEERSLAVIAMVDAKVSAVVGHASV
ncbi:hypothetical protein [Corallococcus sp. RDP092CA]|uniref:hypothetical protein n=1 Tax=Corallococcus sp. RDP092CA TaxID=3109369 RepID=UPI0035B01000